MSHGPATSTTEPAWPPWWRLVLVAACTLILCSCRGMRQPCPPAGCPTAQYPPGPYPALPQQAFTGVPAGAMVEGMPFPVDGEFVVGGPEGMVMGAGSEPPLAGPWAPPGFSQPWPQDEYLADGGDAGLPATTTRDWEVRNLGQEDTIAHFDTLDGQTVVEPSNRVYIYSPRFGAVRQVVSLRQDEQLDRWSGVHLPSGAIRRHEVLATGSGTRDFQPTTHIGQKLLTTYRRKQGDGAVSSADGLVAYDNSFQPFEDFTAIRMGIFEAAEMARLAEGVNAAVAWTHRQAVQVILDHQAAMVDVSDQEMASIYTVKEPPANPRLRVIKVASTQFAERGETVDFTIRFDNVGNQVIGNVTIIDNLTTRLEYVPDSAQCSVPAGFSTQRNEGDSLVLRWEISDPLGPNRGGIIRFQCRVR